jgi:hypothetical protein
LGRRIWLQRAAYCSFQPPWILPEDKEACRRISIHVNIGNKYLVINYILPFPPKLYEQVIAAAVGEDHQQAGQVWRQPASVVLSRIEQFLTRLHTANLAYYEHLVWSDVHDFSSYTFKDTDDCEDISSHKNEADKAAVKKKFQPVTRNQLRRQRKSVYASLNAGKSADRHLRRYRYLVEAFIQRCETELSLEEVTQFKISSKEWKIR